MDDLLKSKLNEYKTGLYSSRLNNTTKSFTLRNTSQNNVSRKQGIYSKFTTKANVTRPQDLTARNLSRHDNLSKYASNGFRKAGDQSRNQTSQINGKRANDTLNSIRDTTRNEMSNYTTNRADVSRINGRRILSPPKRQAFRPELINSISLAKTVDISTRSGIPCTNLLPRVLLKDFRRERVAIERDNDGFVLPGLPVQRIKTKADKIEELKKHATIVLNDFLDQIPPVECFYFLSRVEKSCMDIIDKSALLNVNSGLPPNKDSEIATWLQNSVKNGFSGDLPLGSTAASVVHEYPPSLVPGNIARSMISGWNAAPPVPPPETSSKTTCYIKDWTLIKGSGRMDVMLSGDIFDINSHSILEENHVSSKILAADVNSVQTFCCVYYLSGKFHDRAGCIPSSVKRYFNDGRFPKEWKGVIKMWGILNENHANHLPEQNVTTYNRAPYDEERNRIDRIRQAEVERDLESIDRLALERGEEVSRRPEQQNHSKDRLTKEFLDRYFRERVAALEQEKTMMREQIFGRAPEVGSPQRRRGDEEDTDDEDMIPVRDIGRREARTDQNMRSRTVENTSKYGRKRKSNSRYDSNHLQKRARMEQQRMRTPISSGRLSVIGMRTRSALRGRGLDSILSTPKSSKSKNQEARRKLLSRRKTPMPGREGGKGRRVVQEDSISFNDSDLA